MKILQGSNGKIQFWEAGKIKFSCLPSQNYRVMSNNEIHLISAGVKVLSIFASEITDIQIMGGAVTPTTFNNSQELAESLDSNFFFEVATSPQLYRAVVDAAGGGDYTLLSAAIAAGEKSVFVRNGTYTETADIDLTSGTLVEGESTEGVQIILTGGLSIQTATQTAYSTGTISINSDSTTVTGSGTTFTAGMVGEFIRLGQEWYKIDTFTNTTTIDIVDTFRGDDLSGAAYEISTMTTGLQLRTFSVIGDNGAAVNTTPLIELNSVLYCELENIYAKSSDDNIVEVNNSGNIAINRIVVRDGGNGGGVVGNGMLIKDSYTVKIQNSNISSNNWYGIECTANMGVTIESSHINNNGLEGIRLSGSTTGAYIIENCFIEGNDSKGVSSGANVDEVTLTNCAIRGNGSIGVDLDGEGNTITSNVVSDNDQGGISTITASTLTGNQIRNNTLFGITVAGDDCTLSSNVISGNSTIGVLVSAKDNTTITNNIISANTQDGIQLSGACDNTIISNNQILDNTGDGIEISATSTATKILTNVISGSGGSAYNDGASDTDYLVLHTGGISNTTAVDSVAVLDLVSTTKGVLFPRMTAAQAAAITAVNGLMLYATSTDATFTSIGIWAYENGAWAKL